MHSAEHFVVLLFFIFYSLINAIFIYNVIRSSILIVNELDSDKIIKKSHQAFWRCWSALFGTIQISRDNFMFFSNVYNGLWSAFQHHIFSLSKLGNCLIRHVRGLPTTRAHIFTP